MESLDSDFKKTERFTSQFFCLKVIVNFNGNFFHLKSASYEDYCAFNN
jgi:hypothetical protein